MSFEVQQNSDSLILSSTLDISAADSFRDALAQHIERYPAAKVDLSAVKSCDATAIQLLFSARKSAEGRNHSFQVTGISQAVTEACAELGMTLESLSTPAIG